MDQGTAEDVGGVDDPTKDYPSIQSVHSQEDMVADLLQQAAEAGGVVDGQTGIVLDQGEGLWLSGAGHIWIQQHKHRHNSDSASVHLSSI